MEFPKLNLPYNQLRIRRTATNSFKIWDQCRVKWLDATPEEWVRQNFIAYLIANKNCPVHYISQEYPVNLNGQSQRADILVFDSTGAPWLLVECKATEISLSENVMMQAARYNMVIKAPYLIVTNGLQHICLGRNAESDGVLIPCELPNWP
jgi:hypothetical protein